MQKTAAFLTEYMKAYKAVGANGVVVAEPLTGLLSPDLAAEFSEPYMKQVIDAVQDDEFIVIYHNCGNNTIDMIESILRVGAAGYHFGNSIDMKTMLGKIPTDIPVMGNVDPAVQFRNRTPNPSGRRRFRIMEACCPNTPTYHLLRLRYSARHALDEYRRVFRGGGRVLREITAETVKRAPQEYCGARSRGGRARQALQGERQRRFSAEPVRRAVCVRIPVEKRRTGGKTRLSFILYIRGALRRALRLGRLEARAHEPVERAVHHGVYIAHFKAGAVVALQGYRA